MRVIGRALTARQPNASLIMAGLKPVENRSWPAPSTLHQWYVQGDTRWWPGPHSRPWAEQHGGIPDGPFPFRLWIHAGQGWDRDRYRQLDQATRLKFSPERCPRGVLLGSVEVTGCHHADDCWDVYGEPWERPRLCSPWAEPDTYHWMLADPEPLDEPIPMRGHQGLWKLPEEVGA